MIRHRLPNLGEPSLHAPDGRVLAMRMSGAGVVVADLSTSSGNPRPWR